MNLVNEIGVPAMLEQCAEECTELAQACLKLARKIRNENPTPVTKKELFDHLNEETSDTKVAIDALIKAGVISRNEVQKYESLKTLRWEKRMKEFKEKGEIENE